MTEQCLNYLRCGKGECRRHISRGTRSVPWRCVALVLVVLGGLVLGGCDIGDKLAELFRFGGSGAAIAQEDTQIRIETRVIMSSSFQIEVDDSTNQTPAFEVKDGATQYTMSSRGTARFDLSDGSSDRFILESGDVVIERPGSGGTGSVTIIRVD